MDVEKYSETVDQFGSKFRFDYNGSAGRVALALREGEYSKIGAMILGSSDFISITTLDAVLGSGFGIKGRLCDANDEEVRRVVEIVRTGGYISDRRIEKKNMEDAEEDVYYLMDIEKGLYLSGLVLPVPQHVIRPF